MAERSTASISYVDYDNEIGSVSFNINNIGRAPASNSLSDRDGWMNDLRAALDDVLLGNFVNWQLNVIEFEPRIPATSKLAQRETKWLVHYIDNEAEFSAVPPVPNPGYGRAYWFELPTADLSLLQSGGSYQRKELDITAGVGLALKEALEQIVVSPTGGAIQVQMVEHVGRNS